MPQRIVHPKRLSRLDIELDLMPTDRIFQRWARSVGDGLPAEKWSDTHTTTVALPDDAAIEVDRYVCRAGERMFLHSWYRGQDPSTVIGKRLGLHPDDVYLYWRKTLAKARSVFSDIPCVAKLMQREMEHLERALEEQPDAA